MKLLIYLLLALLPLTGFAAPGDPLFQVECIIFKFVDNDYSTWQPTVQHDLSHSIELIDAAEMGAPKAFQLLPTTQHQLTQEEEKLHKNNNYEVILHQAWLQPITHTPVHLHGDNSYMLNEFHVFQIDGCVTITENGYFSINADFFLTEQTRNGSISKLLSYHLLQARRTRENELNYIDSPQLGILLKIIPTEYTQSELPPPDEFSADTKEMSVSSMTNLPDNNPYTTHEPQSQPSENSIVLLSTP